MKNIKKNKNIWKQSCYVLTVASVLLLVYSLFQPSIALSHTNIVPRGNKPVLDGFHSHSIRIRANDPADIDQNQEQVNDGHIIGYFGSHGSYKQLIYNDNSLLIGFDVVILKYGTPTEPLYIGVLKDGVDDYESPLDFSNYHAIAEISSSMNIPNNEMVWMTFDISSNPYDKRKVNIVVFSLDDPYDGDFWACGYSTDNPYNDGDPSFIWDTTLTWFWDSGFWGSSDGIYDAYDFAFVTYTEGGNGGDIPVINITTSYSVMAIQSLGILSLLGGIVSGIKFRWF